MLCVSVQELLFYNLLNLVNVLVRVLKKWLYTTWYIIIYIRYFSDALKTLIKRVQGCSQSDALKWVTCALFIFSLTCTECKKCAAKKHNALCVWSCGRFAMQRSASLAGQPGSQVTGVQRTPTQRVHAVIWRAALVYLFTFFNLFARVSSE